jgi:hypothetical protein
VAAANWHVIVIQAVADSLFKALIAMPLLGGIFLVALVVGADPSALMSLDWRDLTTTIIGALMSRPIVLIAFLASLAIVVVGGSLFVFLVKAGTVSVLVRAEREAGPIEQPPLQPAAIARASAFSIERFWESAETVFPRYARLGAILMTVYLASGGGYLAALTASRDYGAGFAVAALTTGGFVAWITIVNLLYLLMQIVIVADDCSVGAAINRVAAFIRRQRGAVLSVFLVVLILVVFAQGASLLATAALGLIGFIPILGLTVLPLQLLAWLFRALVFQYIGLASVGAYVKLYREVEPDSQRVFSRADLRPTTLPERLNGVP